MPEGVTSRPAIPKTGPALTRGLAGASRHPYLEGRPWPHLVIDGALTKKQAAAATVEIDAVPKEAMTWQVSRRIRKASISSLDDLGSTVRAILADLADPATVGSLSLLTGVDDLIDDPRLTYAGVYVTPPGGWQKVHEDFPKHPVTGLWNRVAVLVYLSEWHPGDGGELELWPRDMSACGRLVEPIAGRMVVFETSAATRHGIRPVNPGARARYAIGTRYYSPRPPAARPSSALRRSVRRPGESLRELIPTVGEMRDYLRAYTAS